jgi:ectoine hydroxylase-related dioxygenase (phytanoyl-CoA dioxygenase family)
MPAWGHGERPRLIRAEIAGIARRALLRPSAAALCGWHRGGAPVLLRPVTSASGKGGHHEQGNHGFHRSSWHYTRSERHATALCCDRSEGQAVTVPDTETVQAFARDGAVVVRGVFAEWIEALREGTRHVMQRPSPLERTYHPRDGSARFFQDLCNWQRIAPYEDFVRHSKAAAVAASLMQSRTARFFHDHVLVKEPGSSIRTPWHQDGSYYCAGGPRTVSLWIPLDPVAHDISLQCVAGSHLWGVSHRAKRFDGSDLYEGDDTTEMPDIDARAGEYRILSWALDPGDAVAFDFRTAHGAAANTSTAIRRVFSARWIGDGGIFIDRKGKGSPPFRHLTLATGAPFEGKDFPLCHAA